MPISATILPCAARSAVRRRQFGALARILTARNKRNGRAGRDVCDRKGEREREGEREKEREKDREGERKREWVVSFFIASFLGVF